MKSLLCLALAALLALGMACSDDTDDDNTPAKDKGLDMAADVGTTPDSATTEGGAGDGATDGAAEAAVDQAADITPDISPDTGPATNKWWEEVKYGLPGSLNKISGASSSLIFAVGDNGLIMKTDGKTWTTMTNPDTNKSKLTTLWTKPTASYFYALGDGVILYYLNSQWYKGYSSSYSSYSHTDMWGAADPTLFSVGDGVLKASASIAISASCSPEPRAADHEKYKTAKEAYDASKPKRPRTAYAFFMKENRANIAAKNPGTTPRDLMKYIAADWKKLSDNEKAKYSKMASDDRERWDRDRAASL